VCSSTPRCSTATRGEGSTAALLYHPVGNGRRLWFQAEDVKGRSAAVEVTDLRLFLFANGIGVLSLGVEAFHLSATQALWINESLRKVYPSSGRQVREGRIPNRMALVAEWESKQETICEEIFSEGSMSAFLPPLGKTITSLLYFTDYKQEEFEPVLDERMIVYSYVALDRHLWVPVGSTARSIRCCSAGSSTWTFMAHPTAMRKSSSVNRCAARCIAAGRIRDSLRLYQLQQHHCHHRAV